MKPFVPDFLKVKERIAEKIARKAARNLQDLSNQSAIRKDQLCKT